MKEPTFQNPKIVCVYVCVRDEKIQSDDIQKYVSKHRRVRRGGMVKSKESWDGIYYIYSDVFE